MKNNGSSTPSSFTSPFPFPKEGWLTRFRRLCMQFLGIFLGINVLLNAAYYKLWLCCCRRNKASRTTYPQPHPPSLPSNTFSYTLRANECSFHIVECGSPPSRKTDESSNNRPVILLLHGFPETWYCWHHLMNHFNGTITIPSSSSSSSSFSPKLASNYRIVAVDLRGCGESESNPSWPLTAYSIQTLIEDIRQLIIQLKCPSQQVTLVAHDWGGLIAWGFAAAFPLMVKQLCILAAPHPRIFAKNMSISQLIKSWYIIFFQIPYLPEWYMRFNDLHFVRALYTGKSLGVKRTVVVSDNNKKKNSKEFQHPWINHDDIAIAQYALTLPNIPTSSINYYRNVFGVNRDSPFGFGSTRRNPLPMPVLHLWGDSDGALGTELTKGTEEYCKNYELVVLRNASHWLQQDAVEEVAELLVNFINTNNK